MEKEKEKENAIEFTMSAPLPSDYQLARTIELILDYKHEKDVSKYDNNIFTYIKARWDDKK